LVNFDDEIRALNSCEFMGMINFMNLMCYMLKIQVVVVDKLF